MAGRKLLLANVEDKCRSVVDLYPEAIETGTVSRF